MTTNGWLQLAIYLVVLLLLVKPLGLYMAGVFDGSGRATRVFAPIERALYRLCRIDAQAQMSWKQYALASSVHGCRWLYAIAPVPAPPAPLLTIGAWHVDLKARSTRDGAGAELHLTPIEYRLLEVLAQHIGFVVTHRVLLQQVWGPASTEQTHYLRVYMKQLRSKLEPDPARPHWLLTETGVGYRLAQRDEAP